MNRFPATRRRRLFQVSRAPAPHDGADHSRVKQVLFQESRAPAPHDGADHSRVKQVCFRQVGPLPCRADYPRVKQSEIDYPVVTLVSRRG